MSVATRPAIFLDRDGVIVENCDDYLTHQEDIRILPGAAPAIRRINKIFPNMAVVIVTNQSAIGRGIITFDHAMDLHQTILAKVEAGGGRIDATYLCPHHPDDNCSCRKPTPGMLLRAERELGIDLARSFLIGDALTDLGAASAAGVQGVLVRTGRGSAQESLLDSSMHLAGCHVVNDLSAAVDHICRYPSDIVATAPTYASQRWTH